MLRKRSFSRIFNLDLSRFDAAPLIAFIAPNETDCALPCRVMERLIEAVREVSNGVLSVLRLLQGAKTVLNGDLRMASTDTTCDFPLPGILAPVQSASPCLEIEGFSSNGTFDFERMEADVLCALLCRSAIK